MSTTNATHPINELAGIEEVDIAVIGGGQSGLSVGYHLQRRNQSFVILDANERTGDSWRNRWDSLKLFTAARFSSLDGMPFPTDNPHELPTKDEMGDYLEAYAQKFDLPVRNGRRVQRRTCARDEATDEEPGASGPDVLVREHRSSSVCVPSWQLSGAV